MALTQVLWHGSKPKPSRKISQGCPRTVQNQKGWHPLEVAETNKTQRPKILRHSTFAKKTHVPHLFANAGAPTKPSDGAPKQSPAEVHSWPWPVFVCQFVGFTALGVEKRWSQPQKKLPSPTCKNHHL